MMDTIEKKSDAKFLQSGVSVGRSSASAIHSNISSRHSKLSRHKSLLEPGQIFNQLQRQLWKHAHATSSQVALIFCDSKGTTQILGTSAFQGYLEKWIPDDVRQEARRVAVSAADEKKVRRRRESAVERKAVQPAEEQDTDLRSDEEWEEDGAIGSKESSFVDGTLLPSDNSVDFGKKRPSQDHGETSRKRKSVPRADEMRRRCSSGSEDCVAAPSDELQFKPLRLADYDAVTTFYMTRLRQMQQLMCKVVAKAWIKVIEPKKQSNFPYNRGDESKPSWWPRDVRHKEPDHLMKPERLTLLLTMLRSRKVPISKLEAATTEVMVQIPTERIPLLDEIYRVAKQEERYDRQELTPSTIVYVAASERIMQDTAKTASPESRRRSIASPKNSNSGLGGLLSDRRGSGHSSAGRSDILPSDSRELEIPAARGRDEVPQSAISAQRSQNPYSGPNSAPTTLTPLEYPAPYATQQSSIQDHQFIEGPLPIQNSMQYNYLQHSQLPPHQRESVSYNSAQAPLLRRTNTMPAITQAPWPTIFGYQTQSNTSHAYSHSGSQQPSHSPFNASIRRQSAGNAAATVATSPFQAMQLPPPLPSPPPAPQQQQDQEQQQHHQHHQQQQSLHSIVHPQTQQTHPPPSSQSQQSHHGQATTDERSGHRYSASESLGAQIAHTHAQNEHPQGEHAHPTVLFTDFFQSPLTPVQEGSEDGGGRVK